MRLADEVKQRADSKDTMKFIACIATETEY